MVAVDGTFAYFTDVFSGTLTNAPLDGEAPVVLAFDGARAYWPTSDGIMRVTLGGGP